MYERMMDPSIQPSDADMQQWIGEPIAAAWGALRRFLVETYQITPTYNSGGKKHGWSLQYRLGSRPLCYLYPERGSFTALVNLGKVELENGMQRLETFGMEVRQALTTSPRYHDGCLMFIRVADPQTAAQAVRDIEDLVLLKRKPPKMRMN